jgi:hypothetical protein
MKRILWLLLLLQLIPVLLLFAGASGILDPLGRLVVNAIPVPAPGAGAGLLITVARFVTAYWFFACIWLIPLGALAAVVYVAFDATLTKTERFAWAVSFVLGQPVTVVLYCVLQFLAVRK